MWVIIIMPILNKVRCKDYQKNSEIEVKHGGRQIFKLKVGCTTISVSN